MAEKAKDAWQLVHRAFSRGSLQAHGVFPD